MSEKLSPLEKGVLNAKNYEEYVAGLERDGKKFPINQYGGINKDAVASACGFNRQVFSPKKNKKMADRLADDVDRIGTVGMSDGLAAEISDEPFQESEGALAKKLKKSTEQVGRLKKDLALKEATVTALQAQIIELENEKARFKAVSEEQKNSFDYMVSTGRRFAL